MKLRARYALLGLLLVTLLTACGPTPAAPSTTTSPLATPIPEVTAAPTAEGSQLEVTLDNQGQTIALHPGDRFLLKLGDEYQWDITIDNEAVVSRVIGITVVKGAQGVYEAGQAGSATLTAMGDPVCRTSKPPCAMPSRSFTVQLTVQ